MTPWLTLKATSWKWLSLCQHGALIIIMEQRNAFLLLLSVLSAAEYTLCEWERNLYCLCHWYMRMSWLQQLVLLGLIQPIIWHSWWFSAPENTVCAQLPWHCILPVFLLLPWLFFLSRFCWFFFIFPSKCWISPGSVLDPLLYFHLLPEDLIQSHDFKHSQICISNPGFSQNSLLVYPTNCLISSFSCLVASQI